MWPWASHDVFHRVSVYERVPVCCESVYPFLGCAAHARLCCRGRLSSGRPGVCAVGHEVSLCQQRIGGMDYSPMRLRLMVLLHLS